MLGNSPPQHLRLSSTQLVFGKQLHPGPASWRSVDQWLTQGVKCKKAWRKKKKKGMLNGITELLIKVFSQKSKLKPKWKWSFIILLCTYVAVKALGYYVCYLQ